MQEPHGEGVTTHTDPKLCGPAGNGRTEALAGESTGRVLSRVILDEQFGVPMLSKMSEGKTEPIISVRWARTPRGRRPQACADALCAGTGRSLVWPGKGNQARAGNPHGASRR
jgi:hypothetical protein